MFGTGDLHTRRFQDELKPMLAEHPDVMLHEIDGANHLFNRIEWSENLVDRTIGWVLQTSRTLDAGAVRAS
jgi:hypothetical protein